MVICSAMTSRRLLLHMAKPLKTNKFSGTLVLISSLCYTIRENGMSEKEMEL